MKENQPLLILIGAASEYFDLQSLQPIRSNLFKYLIIKEPDSTHVQMMVMVIGRPFKNHAEALLNYMEEHTIPKIIINGGGKFKLNLEEKTDEFYDTSLAFGWACEYEVISLTKMVWPDFTPNTEFSDPRKQSIDIDGKLYSIAEVKKQAEYQ